MKNKSMKNVEDFIVFENRKTPNFYNKEQFYISHDFEPLDFVLSFFIAFLATFLFILFVSTPMELKSSLLHLAFGIIAFLITFLFMKRDSISHNFTVSINESLRITFENSLIYHEEKFNDLMYIIFPYLKDEDKNSVLNNVITKNFSNEDFHILYNACVEAKKNSLAFIETLKKENDVIFFEKKHNSK